MPNFVGTQETSGFDNWKSCKKNNPVSAHEGEGSIRRKSVYQQARKLTVVEDYPDASTVFRNRGMGICGFFLLYGPWNDGLGDR